MGCGQSKEATPTEAVRQPAESSAAVKHKKRPRRRDPSLDVVWKFFLFGDELTGAVPSLVYEILDRHSGTRLGTPTLDLMKELIDLGADPDTSSAKGLSALHVVPWCFEKHTSATEGRVATVKCLLKAGANIEVKDSDSWRTPLHMAAVFGSSEITELLLNAGADVGAKNKELRTPLHDACGNNTKTQGTIRTIKLLLAAGADIEAFTKDQRTTPLINAIFGNNPEAVKVLLDAGANTEARDSRGTPLHWGAHKGSCEVVERLLSAGADPEAKDATRRRATPLHNCFLSVPAEAQTSDEDISRMINALVKAGADIEAKTAEDGETPLHVAAKQTEHPGVIKGLLKAGANIEARGFGSSNGWTPLHAAAKNNTDHHVIKALLKGGAKIEAKCNRGFTALHYAARFNNIDVVKTLWEAGANHEACNDAGDRPLNVAKNAEVIQLLSLADKTSRRPVATSHQHQTIPASPQQVSPYGPPVSLFMV